ncbi:MAG: hypothetical protein GEV09_25825, partial [Pseudonocardiaceae bacterium]|nr:hypothetical protein [Pseudonocardiaceae bacterium]
MRGSAVRLRANHWGVLLIALALPLAACGGDGESNGEPADADADADADAEAADGGEAFYEGQTVEIIIPFGSGGGTDANCRFLAEWFSRTLEGQPTVQGVNVPGGGGLLGANQFELQSPRDGTAVMCTASSNLILPGLGHPEVRYDTSTWTPVIGVPHNGVVSVRQDSGIEEDGSNALDIDWVTAMREPGGVDTLFLLAYELLGLNVDPVFGYDGAGATRVALEQGETNLDWQTTGAYDSNVVPLIEAGDV